MKAILGTKIKMTALIDESGATVPLTAIAAGPCPVVQVKTPEKDGYAAIQLGWQAIEKESRVNRPRKGHFKRSGATPTRMLREVRVVDATAYQPGQMLTVDMFAEGDLVDVTGTSKGRGFAGGIKRCNYRGGRMSHGSMFHRAPGSIGASSFPSRVHKGHHLPGQMGAARVTVQRLRVVKVDKENNILYVRGAVPGASGGAVMVRATRKPNKK
ncbi:50S ribosomal protein L3 [bacterium]|nr:50S ribosomal protein L3 [bacterium]